MSRVYTTVFKIDVEHSFYTSGYSPDFSYYPSPETSKTLGRLRARLRNNKKTNPTGFQVYQEGFPGSPPSPIVAIPDDTKLVFYFKLNNPDFLNISDLPDLRNGTVLYFKNTVANDTLHTQPDTGSHLNNLSTVRLRSFEHDYSFFKSGETEVRINIFSPDDLVTPVFTQDVTGSSGNFETRLDLTSLAKGHYKVMHEDTDSPPNPLADLDFDLYLDPDAISAGIMGIAEISKTSTLAIQGKAFTVEFLHRQEFWKYFLVIKNDTENTYAISDTEEYSPPTPIVFTDETGSIVNGSADDLTRNMLLEQNPGATVNLFISDTEIPYSEIPKKYLELTRKKGAMAAETVFTNLPAPSIKDVQAQVVVCIVKPETLTLLPSP